MHLAAISLPQSGDDALYKIKSKKLEASMVETDGGFVVKAGSQAGLKTSKSIAEGWLKIRKKSLRCGSSHRRGWRLSFR
jgi:hypothetical protein